MSMIRMLGTVAIALLGVAAVVAVPARASTTAARAPVQSQDKQTERQREAEKQKQEKERTEKAREQQKTKGAEQAKPNAAGAPSAPSASEQREIAKKAAHFEKNHRMVQARIDRLIRIYKSKGDTEKVRKLEDLKARQLKRNENAMEGFRKKLSAENWGKLNSEMQKHHGRDEHQKDKPPQREKTAPKPEKTPPKGGGQ
jgi:hypothetical protein